MTHFTRRKIMLGITLGLNSSLLASCNPLSEELRSASTNSADQDATILADVAYSLFPHQSLNKEMYNTIAMTILAQDNPEISQGLGNLSAASNGNWLLLDSNTKTEILGTMQNTVFFGLVRVTAINVLYGTPEFFDLVGYGGSAIEKGGYINRGLDDIDWLPATGALL